jgi:hypothetical protein
MRPEPRHLLPIGDRGLPEDRESAGGAGGPDRSRSGGPIRGKQAAHSRDPHPRRERKSAPKCIPFSSTQPRTPNEPRPGVPTESL